jgi:hypothetical protein
LEATGAGAALVGGLGLSVVESSTPAGLRKTNRTPDTTMATIAAVVAIRAAVACRARYHGVGAGLKPEALSNASNRSS